MHMADALISPAVGGAFYVLSGTALGISAKKLGEEADLKKVPLMGILGAFVFAGQMLNFSIPGTGSSGHLVGGMLLTILLGPFAGFIVLSSVLIIQALFFADGGLLALGCNIWNMAFYSCFIGWLIYRALAGKKPSLSRVSLGALITPLIALELGAFTVVIQTLLSGRSELPFREFSALMLGIHFPIGLIEGVITVAVINFVFRIRPELVQEVLGIAPGSEVKKVGYQPFLLAFGIAAIIAGGLGSWFASTHPDGLEWSIFKTYGKEEIEREPSGIAEKISRLQEKLSFLPDYSFPVKEEGESEEAEEDAWPAVSAGTSVSGLIGSVMVLALVALLGVVVLKLRKRQGEIKNP